MSYSPLTRLIMTALYSLLAPSYTNRLPLFYSPLVRLILPAFPSYTRRFPILTQRLTVLNDHNLTPWLILTSSQSYTHCFAPGCSHLPYWYFSVPAQELEPQDFEHCILLSLYSLLYYIGFSDPKCFLIILNDQIWAWDNGSEQKDTVQSKNPHC